MLHPVLLCSCKLMQFFCYYSCTWQMTFTFRRDITLIVTEMPILLYLRRFHKKYVENHTYYYCRLRILDHLIYRKKKWSPWKISTWWLTLGLLLTGSFRPPSNYYLSIWYLTEFQFRSVRLGRFAKKILRGIFRLVLTNGIDARYLFKRLNMNP